MSEIYDTEVEVLLKIGGQKALENQYKNISRRLDKMSDENKSLKQRIAELESFSVQAERDSTSLVFDLQQKIKSLQEENHKLYNQLMENEKDYQAELEKMNRLVSDLYNKAQKNNKNYAIIVSKEINGQTYVQLEDFMSVVNDLQAEIGT